jgi:hypothetical protein
MLQAGIRMSNEDLILEHKEALETVANADCSASWIAKELLESVNIDTSQTTPEPKESLESPTEPTEKQPEGSVFAY